MENKKPLILTIICKRCGKIIEGCSESQLKSKAKMHIINAGRECIRHE